MKVYLWPFFGGEDTGDGGVRRVVEKQTQYLPQFGVEVASQPEEADVLAFHIQYDPAIIKRFPDKPIVAHCHGLYWSEYEWEAWAKKANRVVLDLITAADVVTSPSEWVSQTVRRHTARRVETIYHGIDMEEFLPGENMGYVLWNKTRIDPICEPYSLQQVATLLPDVKFVSTFGEKRDNLIITGKVPYDEAKEYVRNAGVYLATSRETFGIGTLEAMAAGVPVVGYNWGGQREIITHEVDGWLAPPYDSTSLAEGIRWAIENREKVGKAARTKALRFGWDTAAAQYAAIYGSMSRPHSIWFQSAAPQDDESMGKRPIVSVIVTAYKLEEYLDACLDSVAASDYEDFECIVVDDASPDRCGEIAEAWAARDHRFHCLHNTENQYLAGARNTGISAAQGKYIFPLDADDRITPETLDTLVTALEKDKTLHIAYGNVLFVDTDGKPEENQFIKEGHSGWPIDYNFEWHVHLKRNLLPYASMFRKSVWELTGGYRTRYRAGEDADFWMRAASYGFRPAMVTKNDTLIYTDRPNSMSHTEQYVDWSDWYPWVRHRDMVLAGAVNGSKDPKVSSFEPVAISVIIPVGPGHQKYLLDAIDSVQAQIFRNWECIVVNDTDELLPNIPSWVRVIETDGKIGPAGARNLGIHIARGALFLPLDADDFLQPGALEAMFKVWLDHQDHIIYCDFHDDQAQEGKFIVHQNPDYNPWILVENGCLHPVTALTPKKYWTEIGGYDEDLPGWEDWGFQLACAERGYCSIRVPLPLFTYRKHTGKRRNGNYGEFETSKQGILKKFGKYFGQGREQLMACGSCGANRTSAFSAPSPVMSSLAAKAQIPPEGAMILRCNSDKLGDVTYIGPSGTQYIFAAGDEKFVLEQDVQFFIERGFTVVNQTLDIRDEPVLQMAGVNLGVAQNIQQPVQTEAARPMLEVEDLPQAIPSQQPSVQQMIATEQHQEEEPSVESETPRRPGRPSKRNQPN